MTSNSISSKLSRRLLVVISITSLIVLAILFIYLRHETYEQVDDSLKGKARLIAAILDSSESIDEKHAMLIRAMPTLGSHRTYPDFLEAWDKNGQTVFQSPSLVERDRHLALFSPNETRFRIVNMKAPDDRIGRGISSPLNRGEKDGVSQAPYSRHYSFVLIASSDELHEMILNAGLSLLVIGGALTVAVVFVVISSVRAELEPLRNFSDEVGKLNETTLSRRFDSTLFTEELQPIALRLNDLFERLEQAFARERRFTGNVAHELRTPLAELRCMIEVARKWPLEGNELDRHHHNALMIVRRMSAVVENLIRLVRSQGLQSALTLEIVDLPACLHAAWLPYEQRARQRGVSVAFQMPEQLEVRSEPVVLVSMLDNLFHNASTYSTERSQIECIVDSTESGSIRIQIINETSDMTDADLQHVDEPFWRKDASRTSTDHAGLGLSLVAEYAKLLNLNCNYRLTGNQFVVEITGLNVVPVTRRAEPAVTEFLASP